MPKSVEVGEAEEEAPQWQNKQQLLLLFVFEAWFNTCLRFFLHGMSFEEGEDVVTGKILSWRGVCAKKHTFLLQFLPSLQASVLYLEGCSQHSNTPWAYSHASPRLHPPRGYSGQTVPE